MSGCGLTVLTAREGYRAAKTLTGDDSPNGFHEVSPYDLGGQFAGLEIALRHLDDVADVVTMVAELPEARAVLVRGQLTDAARANPNWVNRRMNPRSPDDHPSIKPASRRWIMLDIDRFETPEGLSMRCVADHPAIIDAAVRAVLHPAFHEARCFYQLSNSSGLTTTLAKMHLFYWLDTAQSDDDLRRIVRAVMPGCDHSVLNPVQPHYVAHPRILPPAVDPLAGHRLGWRQGTLQAVTLPALPAPPPRAKRAVVAFHASDRDPMAPASAAGGATSLFDDLQRTLGDGPGRDGFHTPLLLATARYAGAVAGGFMPSNDDGLITLLLRLIERAPGQRQGYDETYLRRAITGAHRLISNQNFRNHT